MSQELIARWSGRKDMSQNAAYDHVSGRALAKKVRSLVDQGLMKGPIADVANKLPPADREAFLGAEIASAHVTEIGLCVHDWSLAPCPTHGDCANCNEHLVDKGNATQRTEAERQLAEAEHMLAIAERERADGTHGAARWVDAHRRRRDGMPGGPRRASGCRDRRGYACPRQAWPRYCSGARTRGRGPPTQGFRREDTWRAGRMIGRGRRSGSRLGNSFLRPTSPGSSPSSRAWPALPLTWENIRARIGVDLFGHGDRLRRTDATVWSRQALSGNALIKKAYIDRRAELLDAEKRGKRLRSRKRAPNRCCCSSRSTT